MQASGTTHERLLRNPGSLRSGPPVLATNVVAATVGVGTRFAEITVVLSGYFADRARKPRRRPGLFGTQCRRCRPFQYWYLGVGQSVRGLGAGTTAPRVPDGVRNE